jgi:hypothetical protein
VKTCPTCNRTYDDDTLSYCLYDGAILASGSLDSQATQRIPAPPTTDPRASTDIYTAPTWSSAPPPQIPPTQLQYGAWAEPQKRSGSGTLWVVAGVAAVLLLALGIGAGIILSRGNLFGENGSQDRSTVTNKNDSRGSDRSSVTTNPTPQPTPTPTPTPEVPAAEKLGLVGNWSGLQNNAASSLTIVSGQGNAFSGTKVTGDYQISFVGSIDPATRRVTIKETRVLKGTPYSNGKGWSLGSETGTLSADGRKLTGKGNDQYNPKTPYSWSYTRK